MRFKRLAAKLAVALFTVALALPAQSRAVLADEPWLITSWHSDITIQPSSDVKVVEDIRVDFGATPSHGIYRTIPIRYAYDKTHDRVIGLAIESVTDGSQPLVYQRSDTGNSAEIRIGDPNVTVTGAQRYVLTFVLSGVMTAFADHDELYWNVDSPDSPVAKQLVTATVHLPAGSLQKVACYQGPPGSTSSCTSDTGPDSATFTSEGPVAASSVMSVVVALNKGAVTVTPPLLVQRPRQFPQDAFDINPATLAVSLLLLVLGVGFAVWTWWRRGRDREYLTRYYLDGAGHDRIEPLFHHDVIAVEFEPPQHLRPAQLGLILDERADTKDVTATIVDLAVRGYLTITETGAPGIFPQKDWILTSKGGGDMKALTPYEQTILNGLFEGLPQRKLSDLKGKFKTSLDKAESQIYADATERKFFTVNPRLARLTWIGAGIAVAVLGGLVCWGLGVAAGWGLPGATLLVVGLVLAGFGYFMPQRTAVGRELLHQTLGFRLYMTTAERYRQQFAEKAEIFTQLLPYAIVFGCVTRWAKAFEVIDTSAADGWYVGPGPFQAALLVSTLESFNSSLATTLSAVPAASGVSGFGAGGFSGGGFGGGGVGRW